MTLAVIITNILLTIAMGFFGVALLVNAGSKRPIIIKEAKALREYYEARLEYLQEKTEKAEQNYTEYKRLYESELQKNGDVSSLRGEKIRLEAQVKRLSGELNSCDDRINDMAQENAYLKEQIEALKKPVKGKKNKNEGSEINRL